MDWDGICCSVMDAERARTCWKRSVENRNLLELKASKNYSIYMSDPNTSPPMDDSSPEEAPTSTDQPSSPEEAVPAASKTTSTSESSGSSIPMDTPPTAGVGLGQGTLAEGDEKTMGLLAHLLGGFTYILGPLIIWLIKKDESPFVNDQGKEALNFQITILIGFVAASIIAMIPIIQCVAALLYPAIGIVSLIFGVLGGLEANKGNVYRYPFVARFVS